MFVCGRQLVAAYIVLQAYANPAASDEHRIMKF